MKVATPFIAVICLSIPLSWLAAEDGLTEDRTLYRYCVNETRRDRADVRIAPQTQYGLTPASTTFKDRLRPMSLTIYSTYKLDHADAGVIAE